MSILSVVVSRKGSKGLKDKGLRLILGKPLFAHVADYSLSLAGLIPEEVITIVSSDSEGIRDYCLAQGITFFPRPESLATDTASLEDVIYDVQKKAGRDFTYISLLYGNIPTRYPREFLRAYEFLRDNPAYDAVFSMQNVEKYNPSWMFELNSDELPDKPAPAYRRQDLTQYMIHDGHTILFRADHFREFMSGKKKPAKMYEPFGNRIKPMLNDRLIIDIDTERDLLLAEAVMESKKAERKA